MTSKIIKRAIFGLLSILIILASFYADSTVNGIFLKFESVYLGILFSLITNLGIVLIAMVAIPSIRIFKKDKMPIFMLMAALILSILISLLIKIAFLRQRPSIGITYETFTFLNYSFPSMHSMIVFSLLPVLVKSFERQKAFWISSAFLVAISRIYLGFHFLSDVVFGGILGFAMGKITMHFGEKYRAKI